MENEEKNLKRLLFLENPNEYIFNELNYTPSYLLKVINSGYKKKIVNEKYYEMLINLYAEYELWYGQFKKEIKATNIDTRKIDKAIILVNNYLKSNYSIELFCKYNFISLIEFNNNIDILKKVDSNLVDEYKKANNHNFKEKIYEMLKLCDDSSADIIDYYKIVKIPLNEFYDGVLLTNISTAKKFAIKKLISKYENDRKISKEEILKNRRIINVQYDSKGKYIEGTGKELTLDDKNEIISYLVENEIPITNSTYNAGVNRFKENLSKRKKKCISK